MHSSSWPQEQPDAPALPAPPPALAAPTLVQPLALDSELYLLQHAIAAWHGLPTPLFPPVSPQPAGSGASCAPAAVRFVPPRAQVAHLSAEAVSHACAEWSALCNQRNDARAFIHAFGGQQENRGRCVQSFCACLSSILDRFDSMLLPYEQEVQLQLHALSVGAPVPLDFLTAALPNAAAAGGGGKGEGGAAAPRRTNVPLTLISLQQHVAPFIPQLVLIGDLLRRAAPQLYEGPSHPISSLPAPSSSTLLSLLHSSLDLHRVLCTPALSTMLACLFLACWGPYMEYLDAFTSRGALLPRADEDGFMVRRIPLERSVGTGGGRVRPIGGTEGDDPDAAPFALHADRGDELELRLRSDGTVEAPSFLLPHAQHILLTGRSRAMVHALRRVAPAMVADAGAVGTTAAGSERRKGHQRIRTMVHALLPWGEEDEAESAENNLFAAFHEGLLELWKVHAQPATKHADAPASWSKQEEHARTGSATAATHTNVYPHLTQQSDMLEEKYPSDRTGGRAHVSSSSRVTSRRGSVSHFSSSSYAVGDSAVVSEAQRGHDGDDGYDNGDSAAESADSDSAGDESESEGDEATSAASASGSASASTSASASASASASVSGSASAASSAPASPRRSSTRVLVRPSVHVADQSAEQESLAILLSDADADAHVDDDAESTSSPDLPAAPLDDAQRSMLSIFFDTGFDAVHPLFRPPPEPMLLQVHIQAQSAVEPLPPPSVSHLTHMPSVPATASATSVLSPRTADASFETGAPPLPPPRSKATFPRLTASFVPALAPAARASFVSPVLQRNQWTAAAAAAAAGARPVPSRSSTRGRHGEGLGVEAVEEQVAEKRRSQSRRKSNEQVAPALDTNASSHSVSALLHSLPPCRTAFSLHNLTNLLLFHAHLPFASWQHVLHDLLPRCILTPLQDRFEAATRRFMHTIMHRCGLMDYLSALRELFLMNDGYLSYDLCRALFEKLDAGETDLIGLNHVFQASLAACGSPLLRQSLAHSVALGATSAGRRSARAAAKDSAAGDEADSGASDSLGSSELHGLALLEQLDIVCSIGWPLDSIVTADALSRYARVWRLLLQLRRAEMALNDIALPGVSAAPHTLPNRRAHTAAVALGLNRSPTAGHPLTRSVKFFPRASRVSQEFFALKSELLHFLRTLLAYTLSRANEAPWVGLVRAMERQEHEAGEGAEMEQLREMHDKYLDNILFQCMLTPKLSVALDAIKRVLNLCLELRVLHQTMLSDYMEGQSSDFSFSPAPAYSPASAASSASILTPQQWCTGTSRSVGGGGGGSTYFSGESDPSLGAGDSFRPTRHVRLGGVHSYAQLRLRLGESCRAHMARMITELREAVAFIGTLMTKMVDSGGQAQLGDVLCRLQFNNFYTFDY